MKEDLDANSGEGTEVFNVDVLEPSWKDFECFLSARNDFGIETVSEINITVLGLYDCEILLESAFDWSCLLDRVLSV